MGCCCASRTFTEENNDPGFKLPPLGDAVRREKEALRRSYKILYQKFKTLRKDNGNKTKKGHNNLKAMKKRLLQMKLQFREMKEGSDFFATSRHFIRPDRTSKKGSASMKPATLSKLLLKCSKSFKHQTFVRTVGNDERKTGSMSWEVVCRTSKRLARALIQLGVKDRDVVAVCSRGKTAAWYVAILASILAGGIITGIYPSDTADTVAFKCFQSSSVVAFTGSNNETRALVSMIDKLPRLKAIVQWNVSEHFDSLGNITRCDGSEVKLVTFDSLCRERTVVDEDDGDDNASKEELKKRIARQKPGSVCAFVYTTGKKPRACMISHDNLLYTARACIDATGAGGKIWEDRNRYLSHAPLSHGIGLVMDIALPLVLGSTRTCSMIVCASSPTRNLDRSPTQYLGHVRSVKPTILFAYPHVLDAMAAKIREKAKLLPRGSLNATSRSEIRKVLGLSDAKLLITSVTNISTATLDAFRSVRLDVNEAYYASECLFATWRRPSASTDGTCGWPLPGSNVTCIRSKKIARKGGKKRGHASDIACLPPARSIFAPRKENLGEIRVCGRNIMVGYFANESIDREHAKNVRRDLSRITDSEGGVRLGDEGCTGRCGRLYVTARHAFKKPRDSISMTKMLGRASKTAVPSFVNDDTEEKGKDVTTNGDTEMTIPLAARFDATKKEGVPVSGEDGGFRLLLDSANRSLAQVRPHHSTMTTTTTMAVAATTGSAGGYPDGQPVRVKFEDERIAHLSTCQRVLRDILPTIEWNVGNELVAVVMPGSQTDFVSLAENEVIYASPYALSSGIGIGDMLLMVDGILVAGMPDGEVRDVFENLAENSIAVFLSTNHFDT